jgi:hypothetical protein
MLRAKGVGFGGENARCVLLSATSPLPLAFVELPIASVLHPWCWSSSPSSQDDRHHHTLHHQSTSIAHPRAACETIIWWRASKATASSHQGWSSSRVMVAFVAFKRSHVVRQEGAVLKNKGEQVNMVVYDGCVIVLCHTHSQRVRGRLISFCDHS